MRGQILVAGIGNLFLGDDGFGCEVVGRLTAPEADPLPDGVRVVDYGIRGLHLAYDLLNGWDALVLVDAAPGPGVPGDLDVLTIGPDDLGVGPVDAHGMDPATVLASLEGLDGTLPPTFLIGCRPASVAEGIGLSAPVRAAIGPAADAVRRVVDRCLRHELATGRN